MTHPLTLVVGVLAVVVIGAGVSAAVVLTGDDAAPKGATTTTAAPTTLLARSTTTAPAPATTRVAAPTTARPTTTRPALTRAAATKGLCTEIEAAVRQVVGGNTVGGGLRLLRAVNTNAGAADATVVAPARRMLAAGLDGDLDASAAAALDASAACLRAGFPISLPTSGPGPGIPGRDRPCGVVSC